MALTQKDREMAEAILAGKKVKPATSTTFSPLDARFKRLKETARRTVTGEQTPISTGLQVIGEGLGAAGEVVAGAAGTAFRALPGFIEDPLRGAGRAVAQTKGARKLADIIGGGVQEFQEFEERSPVAGANVRALANIVSSIPVSRGAQIVGRGAAVGTRKVAQEAADTMAARQATKQVKKVSKSAEKAEELFEKATDVAPRTKQKFQDQTGKSIAKFLSENQLPIDVKKGTKGNVLDTVQTRRIISEELFPEVNQQLDEVLRSTAERFNLDDLRIAARRKVVKSPKKMAAKKQEAVLKSIDDFIDAEKRRFGADVNALELNKMKQGFWKFFEGDSIEKNAARQLGFTAMEAIEDSFRQPVIRQLNRVAKDYINALDTLKKIDGSVVRGGVLGKKFNQLIGAVVGARVPVVGPLFGAQLAGKLTDILNNPATLSKKALDQLKKSGVIPENIKTLESAKKFVIQERERLVKEFIQPNIPLLPIGKQIELPARGVLEGQQKLREMIGR